MRFLLDTNAVIAVMRLKPSVISRMQRYDRIAFGLSAIVAHELLYGAFKSTRVSLNLTNIANLDLERISFGENDAREAGEIRAELEAKGEPIGPLDTLIAGQARARDLIVVTRNTREFSRIDRLRVENWEN